jgi:hypothetical protein
MKATKKISHNLFAAAISLLFAISVNAQVTIGSMEPSTPGAVLDLSKVTPKNMGMMLPQVSLTDLSNWAPLAGTATNGMLIFNTNGSIGTGIYYWKDGAWIFLSAATPAANSWSVNGNGGTTAATNFIGTTDNNPLTFKVNNNIAGFIGTESNANVSLGYATSNPSSGNWNTAIGQWALNSNSTGTENIALGSNSLLRNSTGSQNIAIGHNTLLNNTVSNNIAIGAWSMLANNSGYGNIAIGTVASYLSTGSYNVAIGQSALYNNLSDGITAIGAEALVANTEGTALTAIGHKALRENTTGEQNTATGFNSLMRNTTGHNNTANGFETLTENTTGNLNTAIGSKALHQNRTGDYNTAIGAQTMNDNTTGEWNVGCGSGALYSNISGFMNTAVGTSPMWFNQTGEQNVAVGSEALGGNVSGSWNTAVGTRALWATRNDPDLGAVTLGEGKSQNNTAVGFEAMRDLVDGDNNTAMGLKALMNNSTGYQNTAIGMNALGSNTTGYNNTTIGYWANVGSNDLTNATAIGSFAVATASNQVVIGNSNVTSIGGAAAWSVLSDARIKKNIRQNVPGLSFINKLKPITYNLDLDAIDRIQKNRTSASSQDEAEARRARQQIAHTGFIAQEVEEAAKSLGYDFSGIDAAKTENSLYQLRYSEFVVPLVKAVQELSAQNEAKDAAIVSLQNQIDELKNQMKRLLSSGK